MQGLTGDNSVVRRAATQVDNPVSRSDAAIDMLNDQDAPAPPPRERQLDDMLGDST
jgi:hypothetical protein